MASIVRYAAAAVVLIAPGPAAAQDAPPPEVAPEPAASAWRPLDPADTLLIDTTKGRIVIELRPDVAPLTVARIKALTRQGYYDGAQFYRVIERFMAQTGDKGNKQFRSTLPNLKGELTFALSPRIAYASVGGSAGMDVGFVGSLPVMIEPAADQPVDQAPTAGRGWVLYCPGVAAMAHPDRQPDGGNSQFFLLRQPAPHLEKEFAAWGRVIVGQEVVESIRNGSPPPDPDRMTRVRVLGDLPAAQRPRVEAADLTGPALAAAVQAAMRAKGQNFNLCDVSAAGRIVPG